MRANGQLKAGSHRRGRVWAFLHLGVEVRDKGIAGTFLVTQVSWQAGLAPEEAQEEGTRMSH